jgi:cell division protein FtsW
MIEFFKKYFQGDKVIWTIIILLAFFSLAAVYSSTGLLAYKERGGYTEYYLIKHASFILGGIFIIWLVSKLPYRHFARFALGAFILVIPLLAYTLFFGTDINQAKRWISIPIINFTFQTSDFAKLVLVVYLARQLTLLQDTAMELKDLFWPVIFPVVLVFLLVAPANLSTALLILLTSAILIFIGRIHVISLLKLAGIGILLVGSVYLFGVLFPGTTRMGVWSDRVTTFISGSGDHYQTDQAKIAIASGWFLGKGPGNSTQRNVLPSGFSDFIYAIFIEEYGMAGGFLLLILYVVFFFRCVRLVTRSEKLFPRFLVMGLAVLITVQALANMAVAVNLGPVTGVTLPFMSMGGTSLFFFCIAAGMILSVSRTMDREVSVDHLENNQQ